MNLLGVCKTIGIHEGIVINTTVINKSVLASWLERLTDDPRILFTPSSIPALQSRTQTNQLMIPPPYPAPPLSSWASWNCCSRSISHTSTVMGIPEFGSGTLTAQEFCASTCGSIPPTTSDFFILLNRSFDETAWAPWFATYYKSA